MWKILRKIKGISIAYIGYGHLTLPFTHVVFIFTIGFQCNTLLTTVRLKNSVGRLCLLAKDQAINYRYDHICVEWNLEQHIN